MASGKKLASNQRMQLEGVVGSKAERKWLAENAEI